jgi:hypothetical protein
MNDYVSPQVAAAATSTRTPGDVLEARKPVERTKACPFCGEDPPLASLAANGRYGVGCENDECEAQPYVSGATLSEAWARWNRRAV